jgi:hypothetical protein
MWSILWWWVSIGMVYVVCFACCMMCDAWCCMMCDVWCMFCDDVWCMMMYDDVWCMMYDDVWCMMLYDVWWCMMMYDDVWCMILYDDDAWWCMMMYDACCMTRPSSWKKKLSHDDEVWRRLTEKNGDIILTWFYDQGGMKTCQKCQK